MADEEKKVERTDLDTEAQQKRKDEHMANASKNREAWQQKAADKAGRDWTKPRHFQPKDGEV
ncbi:MAG: hypothetical protein AB2L09_12480 [Coriobacteriia bacterium]